MFLRFRAAQLDPFQQELQSQRVDLDATALHVLQVDRLKRPALQSLHVQPETVAVEDQDLDAIARTVEESEEIARESVLAEAVPHQRKEAVDPAPEVDHLRRDEDPRVRRERQHGRDRSVSTRSTVAASTAPLTAIRWPALRSISSKIPPPSPIPTPRRVGTTSTKPFSAGVSLKRRRQRDSVGSEIPDSPASRNSDQPRSFALANCRRMNSAS